MAQAKAHGVNTVVVATDLPAHRSMAPTEDGLSPHCSHCWKSWMSLAFSATSISSSINGVSERATAMTGSATRTATEVTRSNTGTVSIYSFRDKYGWLTISQTRFLWDLSARDGSSSRLKSSSNLGGARSGRCGVSKIEA